MSFGAIAGAVATGLGASATTAGIVSGVAGTLGSKVLGGGGSSGGAPVSSGGTMVPSSAGGAGYRPLLQEAQNPLMPGLNLGGGMFSPLPTQQNQSQIPGIPLPWMGNNMWNSTPMFIDQKLPPITRGMFGGMF